MLILIIVSLWWFFPSTYSITEMFYASNLSTILFNLLPIFPLDGGRVLLGALASKTERKKAFKITKRNSLVLFALIVSRALLYSICAFAPKIWF